MIADNLPIAKVMVLLNEAVIERFKGGVPDQLKSDRFKMGGFAL
jgi:hypothetical protein